MSTNASAGRINLSLYEILDPELLDEGIRLRLILMPDDATPLVLGFENLLTSYELLCNHVRNETFLSLPLPRSPD